MEYIEKEKLKELNPLVFAFVGDAVHSLYVRTIIVQNNNEKAGKLHGKTTKVVCAKNQAVLYDEIFDLLSDEEKRICLTARNIHSNNIPKNTDIETYKKSTSFEALLGYLYLSGNEKRLMEILKR